jgi:hypothetical protein
MGDQQQWPADGGVAVVVAEKGSFDPQNAYLAKGVLAVAGVEFLVSMILIIVGAVNRPRPGELDPDSMPAGISALVSTILLCLCAYWGVFNSNKCCLCLYGTVQILWGLGSLLLGCLCFCMFGTVLALAESAMTQTCEQNGYTDECNESLATIGGLKAGLTIVGFLFLMQGCCALLGGYFGCTLQGRIQPETKIILAAPKGAPTHQKAVQG